MLNEKLPIFILTIIQKEFMMIKVLMAAVAATFAVNANAAEVSVSEACGHLDNHSRFNPTELSEYQECWLDIHGEEAGVLGSLFYTKVGESYVSMPVKELREAGSEAAAKELVIEEVLGSLSAAYIEDLENRIEVLEETARSVEGLENTITTLRTELRNIEMQIDAARDVAHGVITNSAPDATFEATTAWSQEVVGRNQLGGPVYGHKYTVVVNGSTILGSAFEIRQNAISDIVTKVYNTGYDSGYEAGYADGYRAGWDAALDSIQ